MRNRHSKSAGILAVACFLTIATILAPPRLYPQEPSNGAILKGYVRDPAGHPLQNATVSLQLATESAAPESTKTDSEGAFRFASLPAGAYTLRAQMTGYSEATVSRIPVARKEMKKIDLVLVPGNLPVTASDVRNPSAEKAPGAKPGTAAPEFFDEPQFTVAGVTTAANAGGHGSDNVMRTSEALARATVSLDKTSTSAEASPSLAAESSLRDEVARNPKDTSLHHQLADVEEKLGHPLEAVREYQRAAELDASEPNLFDWGAELLTHRALEPATEVFTKGNRLFPKSARMLIALGVSWYARGAYDQAAQCLASASDLEPDNPTPYLFLGKIESAGAATPEAAVEKTTLAKLERFLQLQPDNALANYYFAVALWKQSENALGSDSDTQQNSEHSARVESLLRNAVRLDPSFSAAFLRLGILYAQRADYSQAIAAYQKAIAVSPEASSKDGSRKDSTTRNAAPDSDETLAESHYRLAQVYQRTGDKTHAQEQLQLHEEYVKKTKEDTDRERREIQEFIVSLKSKDLPPR